jgi:hypothetical protein
MSKPLSEDEISLADDISQPSPFLEYLFDAGYRELVDRQIIPGCTASAGEDANYGH